MWYWWSNLTYCKDIRYQFWKFLQNVRGFISETNLIGRDIWGRRRRGPLRRKPCCCQYFKIILYLSFSVWVVVSTRLCHFVDVSVSRPLCLSESYSASQTLQYSPSCSSDDLHQGIAFVRWCDATLSHSCSLLMKTKKAKTAVYGFLNSRSLLLLVGSRVMSLTNLFILLSGQGAFLTAGLHIFSIFHFIIFKSSMKVKILIDLNKKFLENSNRMTSCLFLTIKQLFD